MISLSALKQVNVVVTAITATSISLSWSVVGGSVTSVTVRASNTAETTDSHPIIVSTCM